ncbi:MAG: ice-binding family protein [Gammaproteobacteria bacterium]|nr:ice-binding family protein [Gammaproteobacteria bacterium]
MARAVTQAIADQARSDAKTRSSRCRRRALPWRTGLRRRRQNLGSLTLAPGIYTAPGGSFLIEGSDLTLDGQGNQNATWVFQMASTLSVGEARC